jgi:hypothetical protein
MIIKNKLDKTFGPFGTSTGFFMMIGGCIATWFSPFGALLVLVGAFAAFTSTTTIIDTENKKIRYTDNLFGIIPVGKWMDIQPEMKLGLNKSHRGYVGFIMGTQPVEIHHKDIRIYLYNSDNKQIMPVKKFNSYESSKGELQSLSSLLGLEII